MRSARQGRGTRWARSRPSSTSSSSRPAAAPPVSRPWAERVELPVADRPSVGFRRRIEAIDVEPVGRMRVAVCHVGNTCLRRSRRTGSTARGPGRDTAAAGCGTRRRGSRSDADGWHAIRSGLAGGVRAGLRAGDEEARVHVDLIRRELRKALVRGERRSVRAEARELALPVHAGLVARHVLSCRRTRCSTTPRSSFLLSRA